MYTYVHGYNTGMCTHTYMRTYMYRHKRVHIQIHINAYIHIYTQSHGHMRNTQSQVYGHTDRQIHACTYYVECHTKSLLTWHILISHKVIK